MRRALAILALVLAAGAALWWALPEREQGPRPFLGYVEAESVLVAPKSTGRLTGIGAHDGETVTEGEPLFTLDAEQEAAAVAEAAAQLHRARARLSDLQAARERPAQIEVLEARRQQAQAARDLSRAELERQNRLYEQKTIAKARLDQAETAYRRDESALLGVEREIEAARLPAREAEIEAAGAEIEAAAAAVEKATLALADRRVAAPMGGRVLDVLYRVGEVVPAGQPVVEILPPGNIVLRFYVPQGMVAGLAPGQSLAVACDGCPAGLAANVSFIASEAEFTPPVIFSRQERAKLVFLVEARPVAPDPGLKPGLPVELRPQ